MRVESVLRGIVRPLLEQMQAGIELGQTSGRSAAGRSHLRYQETAALQRQEIVGDAGLGRAGGEEKFRMPRV